MPELAEVIDGLGRAFEEFKTANDERLKQIEHKGHADPALEQKLANLNDAIEKMQERVTATETVLNRPDFGSGSEASQEEKQHKDAFTRWVRKGDEVGLREIERKAMSVGSDPDGGYWVPKPTATRIVETVFATSPMRQLAMVESVGGDRYIYGIDNDEADCGWVGETETRAGNTDTPQIGEGEIVVHEVYAEPRLTQKLLDDAAYDVEGWLNRKVSNKFSREENEAFVSGNGIKKPRGLVSYTTVADSSFSSAAWGTVGHIASGAAGDWPASAPGDVLIDAVYALPEEYLDGAVWLMRRSMQGEVRSFKDGNGNYLWQPSLVAGQPATLAGYPVRSAEDMPAKAANSLSIAFGNFREAYTIVDRLGIRILRDPFTVKGYVKFYTTKRVGGGVVNFQAFKVVKFAAA